MRLCVFRTFIFFLLVFVSQGAFLFSEEARRIKNFDKEWDPYNRALFDEFRRQYMQMRIRAELEAAEKLAQEKKALEGETEDSCEAESVDSRGDADKDTASVLALTVVDGKVCGLEGPGEVPVIPVFKGVRESVRSKILDVAGTFRTTSAIGGAFGAQMFLKYKFKSIHQEANKILKKHGDAEVMRTSLAEAIGAIGFVFCPDLNPAMKKNIESKLTPDDIKKLQRTGIELCEQFKDGRPFVQLILECVSYPYGKKEDVCFDLKTFRQKVKERYKIDINDKGYRDPGFSGDKACGAIVDLFSMMCE